MVFSRICRACACEVNEAHEIENNSAKPQLSLLLERYIPEFDIKIENACLCTDCVSILYVFHNFKRNSLRTEQAISLHIRKHPEVKAVNINDVFTPEEPYTIDGIRPSLETTAETIKKEPIGDTELCLEATAITDGPIKKGTAEAPPQVLTSSAATTIFACEICSRTFCWERSLLAHKRKYHGNGRHYKCDKCSRNFISERLYGRHLEYHDEEPSAGLYTCKICNFVYQSKNGLNYHNIYKHSSKHKCEVCAKRFAAKSTLYEHMRTHTLEKLYYCSQCKYVTTVTTELDRHITEAHNIEAKTKVNKCPYSNCGRVFPSKKSLKAHKQNFHTRARYQCDKCSRDFTLKKKYEEHLAYHKDPDAGRYTCKICNLVYQSQHALRRHNIYKHSSDDQKRFKCEVCARRFVENSTLYEHMRTHTLEKLYYCSKCKYVTTVTTELDKHTRKVHNKITKEELDKLNKKSNTEKQICTFPNCARVFATKKILKAHKQTFHKSARYQCDKCGRDFALKKRYEDHLAYHKKPHAVLYTCNICNFVYPTRHSLRRHNSYKHSSEDQKRFKCEVCAKRFVERTTLYEHMRTHTGERPYKCPMCTYASASKSRVYKHVKAMHIGIKVQFNEKKCVVIP